MPFTEKHLHAPGVIEAGGRQIKRYHIGPLGTVIEDEIEQAAYGLLPTLLPAPDGETPPASFVILHRSSDGAYICAYSWVWGNVIECRTAAAGVPFLGCPDENPCHFTPIARPWIGCVWELAPLEHERSAWVRHVLTPSEPDLPGYLADLMAEGRSGGPS